MATFVVGVPKEIKDNENRVAVQPDGIAELVYNGHQVLVEAGAGLGSRFTDAEYAAAGAEVVDSADKAPSPAPPPSPSPRPRSPI
jgi:alanine dehydrogenase